MTVTNIISLFVVFFISGVSNAGGIGGGGLIVPVLLVVMNFYTHEAIPISKVVIFSGALTAFVLGFKVKHPHRNSITIDYNIPMLLSPMLLFGTMVGVTLNKVLPPIVVIISLTCLLVFNTFKTFQKGLQYLNQEKKGARNI